MVITPTTKTNSCENVHKRTRIKLISGINTDFLYSGKGLSAQIRLIRHVRVPKIKTPAEKIQPGPGMIYITILYHDCGMVNASVIS